MRRIALNVAPQTVRDVGMSLLNSGIFALVLGTKHTKLSIGAIAVGVLLIRRGDQLAALPAPNKAVPCGCSDQLPPVFVDPREATLQ